MKSFDINLAGLTVGMSYDVQTNSGRLFRRVVYLGDSDWNNRPVLCFVTATTDREIQINPSYIESIAESETNESRNYELTNEDKNQDIEGEQL